MSALMMFGNCYVTKTDNDSVLTTVNGSPLNLRHDLSVVEIGSARLDLAILANELTDQQAIDHHEQFCAEVIDNRNETEWTLSGREIHDWLLVSVYEKPAMFATG